MSLLILRDHQQESFNKIRSAMELHQSIVFVAPTGFGKTIMMAYIANRTKSKNKKLFFTVHRRDLITQSAKTLDKFDIDYGIISAGYIPFKKKNIQVCSIVSLKNRLKQYPECDLLVVDEAHHCRAKGWGEVVSHYKKSGAYVIGLTATPTPELAKHFDIIVEGRSVAWLIENKFLSEYRLFIPSTPDVSALHVRMGDYVQKENEELMDKPKITGDMVTHWKKYAQGKLTIGFGVSIAHSKHMAATFNEAGIPSAHLDGDTPHEERKIIIKKFANKELLCIFNCGIFCEGFDLAAQVDMDVTIEALILGKPTLSLTLYAQMVGRVLRYKPHAAIILDHANCAMTHGLPDEERKWSLDPLPSKKKTVPTGSGIKICPKCFAAQFPFRKECSYCHFIFEVQERVLEHAEGDLVEVDPAVIRKLRLKEEWKCKTKEELVSLGKSRGYDWPEQWAQHRWNYRESKKIERMKNL